MGAINKPISGKTNAATGAEPQPVIGVADTFDDNGIATKTKQAAKIKQAESTKYQFNRCKSIPAKNRPSAVEPAKILAI